jgi:hypothetical protein
MTARQLAEPGQDMRRARRRHFGSPSRNRLEIAMRLERQLDEACEAMLGGAMLFDRAATHGEAASLEGTITRHGRPLDPPIDPDHWDASHP